MAAPLEFGRRRRIYQTIAAHPGLHLRELERRMGGGLGDLRYHLDHLEKSGLITSQEDRYRKTFFPVHGFSYPDARLVSLLRQAAPRRILLVLLESGERGFEELRDALRVSKSTLSFHMRKLLDAGLVHASRADGRTEYRLSDPKHVVRVLLQYRESLLDAAIDRAVNAWMP